MDVKEFRKVLLIKCCVSGEQSLVVGVSGGPDSLCLVSMMSSLRLPIIVVHFDHKLRPESNQDAQYVSKFAKARGCRFVLGEGNVRELAKTMHLNLEAAARWARYSFLFEQARKFDAEAVAVGHTADDQVETILLHLLRGSGLDGLEGMHYRTILDSYSSNIPLIRPLIEYWREDTVSYCLQQGIQTIEDRTNLDKRYQRNRIRHELIPVLENYNPQVKKRLWTLGQVVQSSVSGLGDLIKWIYLRCLINENPGAFVALDSDLIGELQEENLRSLLRYATCRIKPETTELDFKSMQRAVSLVKRVGKMGRIDLGDNLQLDKVHGRIYIHLADIPLSDSEWPRIDSDHSITLVIPGSTVIADGWSIHAEIRKVEAAKSVSTNPAEAWLDFDSVNIPLVVRHWQPGDRLQPLGMSGTTKLSDYFINQKIPRPARVEWPMILCGTEIVWAAGLRISEKYRLTSNSRQSILLKLVRD